MTTTIRRAREDDVDFLLELLLDDDVRPFLGAVTAAHRSSIRDEVARSLREPHDFGRFVIEVDGVRAGGLGFEAANRRSRIAHLERLAVHPDFRGRRIGDDAARLFQHHLVHDLGYHRLQLEIYGFNERAQHHADRAGYVREGVRRRAYWRHGAWADGLLYAMLAEEMGLDDRVLRFHDYLGAFNECVRTGDWEPLADWYTADAVLAFEGVTAGPFEGRDGIMAAYRAQPPDDQIVTFDVSDVEPLVARYGWRQQPATIAGRMFATFAGEKLARLVVTFD